MNLKNLLGLAKTVGPIVVDQSATTAVAGTLLRAGTTAAASALTATGVVNNDQSTAIIGAVVTISTILFSAVKKKVSHDEKATLAAAAPNEVGIVK